MLESLGHGYLSWVWCQYHRITFQIFWYEYALSPSLDRLLLLAEAEKKKKKKRGGEKCFWHYFCISSLEWFSCAQNLCRQAFIFPYKWGRDALDSFCRLIKTSLISALSYAFSLNASALQKQTRLSSLDSHRSAIISISPIFIYLSRVCCLWLWLIFISSVQTYKLRNTSCARQH